MALALGSNHLPIDKTAFPEYSSFAETCLKGLSTVYPLKTNNSPDTYGWKFGAGRPPSYSSFGRMRSLLAINDAQQLAPHKLLEVAAGGCGLAATMAQNGCEVTVNDLREDLTRDALAEYSTGDRIRFFGGNMFDLSPDTTGKFDLIVACEIIEHVAHPKELLAHLKTFLLPNGRILLTTPNGLHFRNRLPMFSEVTDFKGLESQQFKPDADGHLFLFSPEELISLAESVGLQVERLSIWGTPMLSGHAGLRYFAKALPIRVSYYSEVFTQLLPQNIRKRLCVALSAVLRLP